MRTRLVWPSCSSYGSEPVDAFWVECNEAEASALVGADAPLPEPGCRPDDEPATYGFLVARDQRFVIPMPWQYPYSGLSNAYNPFEELPSSVGFTSLDTLTSIDLPGFHRRGTNRTSERTQGTHSAREEILARQHAWADSLGHPVDQHGYLSSVEANLFQPLSTCARDGLQHGGGSELYDGPSRPAKMRALHSSAGLAVNVFDYWTGQERSDLANALSLSGKVHAPGLERQFPTGLRGTPPTLDVVLVSDGAPPVAIESKFTEWLTPKRWTKAPFSASYFPETERLWGGRGLVRCQHLAEAVQDGSVSFRYLAAPQLLKHVLGFSSAFGPEFALLYLYYDWHGPRG